MIASTEISIIIDCHGQAWLGHPAVRIPGAKADCRTLQGGDNMG
jgi:hypothetical protein